MISSRRVPLVAGAGITLLAIAACSDSDPAPMGNERDAGIAADAGADTTPPPACRPGTSFGSLTPVPGIEEITSSATLTGDELTLYTIAKGKLAMATRKAVDAPFGEITPISPQAEGDIAYPNVSSDGSELFFAFIPPPDPTGPGFSFPDIYRGKTADLTSVQRVANVNDEKLSDIEPFATSRRLYFAQAENNGLSQRIVSAQRNGDGFGTVEDVKGLEKPGYDVDHSPVVTPDERRIFFARSGAEENTLLVHSASRSDPDGRFENVGTVSELNRDSAQWPVWISADACKIYIAVYTQATKKTTLRFAKRP